VEADYAIFGEPSGLDQITIAYKGSLHLKIMIRTITGHSSAPWLFDNAIEKHLKYMSCSEQSVSPQKKKIADSIHCLYL